MGKSNTAPNFVEHRVSFLYLMVLHSKKHILGSISSKINGTVLFLKRGLVVPGIRWSFLYFPTYSLELRYLFSSVVC